MKIEKTKEIKKSNDEIAAEAYRTKLTGGEAVRVERRVRRKEVEMDPKPMTYKNQPTDNVDCWRLGEACRSAADDPKCGDYIDRGLILLRELEAKGYGVVKLVPNRLLHV